MGKTRGHGSRRGAYRGARAGASKGRGEEDSDSEEEEYEQPRGLGELQRSKLQYIHVPGIRAAPW
jgi:hypothetical protein